MTMIGVYPTGKVSTAPCASVGCTQDMGDWELAVNALAKACGLKVAPANIDQDLQELWTRIVFNILVSNTDDHLRNHGFILEPGNGWRLSDAYDLNPTPLGDGLNLISPNMTMHWISNWPEKSSVFSA